MEQPQINTHAELGAASVVAGAFCYGLSVLMMFWPNYQWAILFAILGIILGNYGFNNLVKGEHFKPSSPIVHQISLFSSLLKSGTEINVLLEIHYPSDQDLPMTLSRIQTQLQRTFNKHFSRTEELSDDPYNEMDGLLRRDIEPLRQDLGLRNLTVRTIDIKRSSIEASAKQSPRIYLGGGPES